MTMLERLGSPETVQPEVNRLVGALYDGLLAAVSNRILATKQVQTPTRMIEFTDRGVYHGESIDRAQGFLAYLQCIDQIAGGCSS